jgi:hypothetical protein
MEREREALVLLQSGALLLACGTSFDNLAADIRSAQIV